MTIACEIAGCAQDATHRSGWGNDASLNCCIPHTNERENAGAWSRSIGELTPRLVVAMATRKVHHQGCRYVSDAGSADFPYADETAVRVLPHCRVCEVTS